MEQALRAQEHEQAKLVAVADSMASGLVLIGAGGEVSYASAQVSEILGPDPEDLALSDQAHLEALLLGNSEDPEATASALQELRAAAGSWHSVNVVLFFPQEKVLRCSVFPVRDNGGLNLGRGLLISQRSSR